MSRVTKEFEVKLSTGKIVTAEFEAYLSTDPHYGADADGNRGMSMDFTDDVQPVTPWSDSVWDKDDDGNHLTAEEKAESIKLLEAEAEGYDFQSLAHDLDDYYDEE